MVTVVSTRTAVGEARDARLWLKERQPGTVAGFRQRLRDAIETLREYPSIGTSTESGARRLPLTPYPYVIVYRYRDEVVTVIAVAHAKQRPGYWRGRQ